MREEIKQAIATTAKDLFKLDIEPEVTRVNEQFGDYATNAALQLAAKTGKKPRDVAEMLVEKMKKALEKQVDDISAAGPGFINFRLADSVLIKELDAVNEQYGENQLRKDKTVVAEYSDPNPFKVLHAGHLYTSIVGDAIANLF